MVFLVAGIYGLLVLVPQYFLEAKTGHDFPPPITHPEYYYGFVGVGVAWQVLFLVLSTNPVRYRLMMIPSMLEKLSFVVPAAILYTQQRIPTVILGASLMDLLLGVLFLIAFVKTGGERGSRDARLGQT